MAIDSAQCDGKLILIIDDDPWLRSMLTQFLESCSYHVFGEERGDLGFQKALELRPDLILLDMNLPGKMGAEVCSEIKQDPRVKDIPIMMITGEKKALRDKLNGFTRGADDYILKPIDIAVLAAQIHSILKQ